MIFYKNSKKIRFREISKLIFTIFIFCTTILLRIGVYFIHLTTKNRNMLKKANPIPTSILLFLLSFIASCSPEEELNALKPFSAQVSDNKANMPAGGGIITIQYNNFTLGNDVSRIVDKRPDTKVELPHTSFYIIWACNNKSRINQYSLTSAKDDPESDPKAWRLSGSNDNNNWTLLNEQSNQNFESRGEVKIYTIVNEREYKYYKLDIKGNHGGPATHIAEWAMTVVYTDIDDLMHLSSGSSYSSITPMGNHYANRHVTTAEDVTWLLDPTNEPPAPASASHLKLKEFPVKLYPFGKPSPADVNQHAIGNCGGIAAMASMAYQYPNFVKSLIKVNVDNTYTVSMFDPQGKPIKVTVTNKFLTGDDRNIDAVSGKENAATWATVLEKAVMKYNVVYKVNPDIGGIGSEHVPPLFTGDGNSFAFSPGKLTGRELARVARVCLDQGYFVVGGFNKSDLPLDNSKTVTAHAYTIMHSTDPNALFVMRNPWGGNPDVDGRYDGVLNIPNNNMMPPTIDFRITHPGIAKDFGDDKAIPYIPPTLTGQATKMRVANYLFNPQPIN